MEENHRLQVLLSLAENLLQHQYVEACLEVCDEVETILPSLGAGGAGSPQGQGLKQRLERIHRSLNAILAGRVKGQQRGLHPTRGIGTSNTCQPKGVAHPPLRYRSN